MRREYADSMLKSDRQLLELLNRKGVRLKVDKKMQAEEMRRRKNPPWVDQDKERLKTVLGQRDSLVFAAEVALAELEAEIQNDPDAILLKKAARGLRRAIRKARK